MYEKIIRKYKDLYENPLTCEPLVQVIFPVKNTYSVRETLDSPEKMMANQLETIEARLAVGDDFLPALRVNFGTAQIAAMYGTFYRISRTQMDSLHLLWTAAGTRRWTSSRAISRSICRRALRFSIPMCRDPSIPPI